MHKYTIDPVAQLEEAGNVYIAYFTGLGEPERGNQLSEAFAFDYIQKIQQLKKTSFMYPPCTVYPFDGSDPMDTGVFE